MLPRSLSTRIYGLGLLVSVAMLLAAGLLLATTDRTRSAFLWVGQNEEVIRIVDEMIGDVREAESGQRGFLLTHAPAYLDTFNERIDRAKARMTELARSTANDPDQATRVAALKVALVARIDALRTPLALAERGRFDSATAFVASGRGRSLMEDVARKSDEIKAAEQSLLKLRMEEAETQARWNHNVLLIGGPVAALLLLGLVYLLVISFRRPLGDLLDAINALGAGEHGTRARTDAGLMEIDRLATAYNAMADRLTTAIEQQSESDAGLQIANAELRSRGNAVELLGGMAHRMQAAQTDEELAEVLRCFLPRVLPEAPGALYVHNTGRNMLIRIAEWGDPTDLPEAFAPDHCWALRRGQSHFLSANGADIRCAHVASETARYHCEPVLAGGEVVGLLHLEGLISASDRFRLAALTENIALALVNQRLQRGLREQSIRDPLTNLFNRRYMEEALTIETMRAGRSKAPLGVLLCDVDHFKRFNDEFGHEAGDVVLQAVAAQMQTQFRDGDIACRYGGEEFAMIVPAAEIGVLLRRAEGLRQAIRGLSVRHRGSPLGAVTMSIGLAMWQPDHGPDGAETLRLADAALYRAKSAGRDRVVVSEDQALPLAAE